MDIQKEKLDKAIKNLDYIGSNLGSQVTTEIKKATAHLRPSAFDEQATGNISQSNQAKTSPR